jgi:succinyl-diaminopimelate desuccinylase
MSSLPDPVELTQHLVQLESTSRGSGQVQVLDAAQRLLRGGGFAITRDDERPPRYLLASSPADGPRLVFVCHVDTVPVDEPDAWSFHPTSGHIADGRLYGRGASDMKSGLAAALVAVLAEGANGADAAPCAILLTTDEEVGCLGAAAAADRLAGLDIGAIVVPESTDNAIALGHRGTSWLRLTARGRAAHAGTPELGHNALLCLARALLDLSDAGPWWGQRTDIGATTVNIATMHAGTAPNIVPEAAEAVIDVRPAAPLAPAEIAQWLAQRHPDVTLTVDTDLPPIATAADDSWLRSLPAPRATSPAVPYFTDAAALTAVWPAAPVAIWGPGQAELAHCRDESVSVQRVREAVELYRSALRDWGARATKERS